MTFLPYGHLRVLHNYSGDNWQDFTGNLSSANINLREMPGTHTASLSFYKVDMDPSQSDGTRVIKKGDRVRISASNGNGVRRRMATFTVKKVSVEIDLTKRVGRQNKVTVTMLGNGVAGVAGVG